LLEHPPPFPPPCFHCPRDVIDINVVRHFDLDILVVDDIVLSAPA